MPNVRDCLAGLLVITLAGTTTLPGRAAPKGTRAERPAEIVPRGQREAKDISYGNWQKLCYKAGGAPTLCRTSITGQFATGQTAIRVDLIEREDSAAARLQLFVPVGMYLQQPPRLSVDQGTPFRVPYTWCLTNLCIAADVASPKIVKDMESGKILTLELIDSNLLAMTTSIPLSQFASVHKGAPARTLEQDIDE
ncbi:invasion-associated locus B family protein [Bradyrhizobium sp. Y36]|uniref:invasion associated locus B family protein n=1 Tax=Bradyrhizobium sp. Y36 TaxID=2035447 RepID=UPI000BEA3560|nr:invasion associated locus B family protein [Bradyrhizobium sp. Y36]PDT90901.1 invasion-associated locus B family protein [Bradyrhizobium sp. Y36]